MATIKTPKTIKDLKPNKNNNIRVITPKQKAALRKSIENYGDLSGVVFNVKSGALISGHQRISTLEGKQTKLVKTKHTDSKGTVAIGHIEVTEKDGSTIRIPYREVNWSDKNAEIAALIGANAHGGDFDAVKLGGLMKKLQKDKFDIELTGLEHVEFLQSIIKHDRSKKAEAEVDETDEFESIDEGKVEGKLTHQCPKCHYRFSITAGKTAKLNKEMKAERVAAKAKADTKAKKPKKNETVHD